MAAAAPQSNGLGWRILLGPTHDWQIPSTELSPTAQPKSSMPRCEICGESLSDGRPFTTDSAGQYPTHVTCSGNDQPRAIGLRPARITWLCSPRALFMRCKQMLSATS